MNGLSPQQRLLLRFILTCREERGYPPTIEEMRRHIKVAHGTAVTQQLTALTRKGYLSRSPGVARGLALTQEGRRALTESEGEEA